MKKIDISKMTKSDICKDAYDEIYGKVLCEKSHIGRTQIYFCIFNIKEEKSGIFVQKYGHFQYLPQQQASTGHAMCSFLSTC